MASAEKVREILLKANCREKALRLSYDDVTSGFHVFASSGRIDLKDGEVGVEHVAIGRGAPVQTWLHLYASRLTQAGYEVEDRGDRLVVSGKEVE